MENYQVTKPCKNNLNTKERTALTELQNMVKTRILRITPADKGGAIVVLNVKDYVEWGLQHLHNTRYYQPLTTDPTTNIAKRSNQLADALHKDGLIDDNTWKWALVELEKVKCHELYFLPKIHKSTTRPPGRPIVSGIQGPTEKLSKIVDHWLRDYVTHLDSHIQDSTHTLREVNMGHSLRVHG